MVHQLCPTTAHPTTQRFAHAAAIFPMLVMQQPNNVTSVLRAHRTCMQGTQFARAHSISTRRGTQSKLCSTAVQTEQQPPHGASGQQRSLHSSEVSLACMIARMSWHSLRAPRRYRYAFLEVRQLAARGEPLKRPAGRCVGTIGLLNTGLLSCRRWKARPRCPPRKWSCA